MNTLLHAADISNPCKPWSVAKRWSDQLILEFFAQGDMERSQTLPPSPNTDRLTTDQPTINLNFIDFIVAPLFVAVRGLLPTTRVYCDQMAANRQLWDEVLDKKLEADEAMPVTKKVSLNLVCSINSTLQTFFDSFNLCDWTNRRKSARVGVVVRRRFKRF
jgi:hypothetical protein